MAVQTQRPSASAASTRRNGAVGRLALPTSLAGTYAAHVSGAGPHQPRSSSSASSSASSLAPQSRELSRSTLATSSDARLRAVLLRVESSMASLVNEEDVQAEARAHAGGEEALAARPRHRAGRRAGRRGLPSEAALRRGGSLCRGGRRGGSSPAIPHALALAAPDATCGHPRLRLRHALARHHDAGRVIFAPY